MKAKAISRCIAAVLFICCICLGLTSCDLGEEKEAEYETVKLTAYNYSDYIFLEMNFESFHSEWVDTTTLGWNTYHIVCAGSIVSSRKGNFQFEDVSLAVALTIEKGWSPRVMKGLEVQLDYDGNGKYSFYLANEVSSAFIFQFTAENCGIKVTSATGTVRIYP